MDCEILITEVFSRKPLWDSFHPQHRNRGLLDKLWAEISNNMNVPAKELKIKWKYFKDQFRRELKKIPKIDSSSKGGSSYEPSWPYFRLLSFLKTQMNPKEISDNIYLATTVTQNIENFEQSDDDVGEEYERFSPVNRWNRPEQDIKKSTLKRLPPTNNTDEVEAKLLKLVEKKIELVTQPKNNEESDDFHFFMSLVPIMKKFDDFQKFRIRSKFHNIIMEELEILSGTEFSSASISGTDSRPTMVISDDSS